VSFESSRAKLARADEHLVDLDDEIAAYLATEPFKLVLNVQPQDERIVLVEFHVAEQPPARFGLLVGDCVGNLRAALDHAICDIVMLGGESCDRTQFPIVDVQKVSGGAPKPLYVGAKVADELLVAIEQLQPFQDGAKAEAHPLAIVRDLSNADKHRTLHVAASYLTQTQAFLQFPAGAAFGGQFSGGAVGDQTPIAAFQFPEPFVLTDHPEVLVGGGGQSFVGVDHKGAAGRPITDVLATCRDFILDVVLPSLEEYIRPRG